MRRSLVRLVAVVLVAGLLVLVLVRPVPVGATASAVDRYRDVVLDDDPVAFWQMQELFDYGGSIIDSILRTDHSG